MKPETLDNLFETPTLIDQGCHGIVYRISKDKVAKFGRAGRTAWFSKVSPFGFGIRYEYDICRRLFEAGISVPRPYGIFGLNPPENDWMYYGFPRKFPAFVMEYIKGTNPRTKKEEARMEELSEREIRKVRSLGFIPEDYAWHEHRIWVPKQDKVYLIDFHLWKQPKRLRWV